MAERANGAGGWSQWAYSQPTGIVASSLPSVPVINTASQPTPTSGLQIGDIITVPAPSITGATSWWISWQRDGVSSEAFATDLDTFPYSYVVQPRDVVTSLVLRTYASNAAGAVYSDSTDIGPVITGTSSSIIDLGSATATENYILSQFDNNWAKTGTATQYRTVTTPGALKTLWDTEIKVGSLSEKWEVTLDWDGAAIYNSNQHTLLSMSAPTGTTNWSDAGGWIYLKNASGKRPGFDNRVMFSGVRGIYIEGTDFYGIYTGSGFSTQQGTLVFNSAGSLADCIFEMYNCRVGRYCRSLTFVPSEVIFGVWSDETCEQAVIEKSAFAGNYAAWKLPAKRARLVNCDVSQCWEDVLKAYPLSGSGYYGVYHYDRLTIRDFSLDPTTAGLHTDLFQTSSNDTPLGVMMLMTDTWYVADHKYASGAGGTQGTTLSTTTGYCDNLFCWRNSGVFCTTPVAFGTTSDSQYTSYIQNCSLGRAGITPSGYSPYPDTKDWSPGFYSPGGPSRSGIGTKIINSTIGQFVAKSWISSSNVTSINYTVSMTGTIPENVFLGASFERGGANTANSIANKFGYLQDTTDQQSFLTWVTANLITKGSYSSQGPSAPVLANYSAPALG